jgi:hypothetical protein
MTGLCPSREQPPPPYDEGGAFDEILDSILGESATK